MSPNPHLHRIVGFLALTCAPALPAPGQSCPPAEIERLEGTDQFGHSLSIDGSLAIVAGGSASPARILQRDENGLWADVAQIPSPGFGFWPASVAIDGETVVVGRVLGSFTTFGRAFIYAPDGGAPESWILVTELDSTIQSQANYIAVAIDGDIAVVGSGQSGMDTGAAVVFERNLGGPGSWGQRAILPAPPGSDLQSRFGSAVAVRGDTIVVGARSTGSPGRAFIFERNAGGPDQWGLAAELVAASASNGNRFGCSVAIEGDLAVIGAERQNASGAFQTGAAYIFERDLGGPGAWGERAMLTAPDALPFDDFGSAVDISGRQIVVGARSDDEPGSAHVYQKDYPEPGAWGHYLKLLRGEATGPGAFGNDVDADGGSILVGAPHEDPDTSGAVYAFAANGPDCNLNSIADGCEIAQGKSQDVDNDGVPDECSVDCDKDGAVDVIEILQQEDVDCNGNQLLDACEIAEGSLADADADGFPDVCDPRDCDGNGIPDVIDIAAGGAADCNGNFMLDSCEAGAGMAWDDGVADQVVGAPQGVVPMLWANPFDAGSGAIIDSVQVAIVDDGLVAVGDPLDVYLWSDPNGDGIPDDALPLRSAAGTVQALSGIDASPELFSEVSIAPIALAGRFFAGVITTTGQFIVAVDAVPDPLYRGWGYVSSADPGIIQESYENLYGVYLLRAGVMDCNGNGVPDACDIADGTIADADGNGISDACECHGDLDGSGSVGVEDFLALLAAWGTTPPGGGPPDMNYDGTVNIADFLSLLATWGACP